MQLHSLALHRGKCRQPPACFTSLSAGWQWREGVITAIHSPVRCGFVCFFFSGACGSRLTLATDIRYPGTEQVQDPKQQQQPLPVFLEAAQGLWHCSAHQAAGAGLGLLSATSRRHCQRGEGLCVSLSICRHPKLSSCYPQSLLKKQCQKCRFQRPSLKKNQSFTGSRLENFKFGNFQNFRSIINSNFSISLRVQNILSCLTACISPSDTHENQFNLFFISF